MPTYETPDPITVTLELGSAQVRVAASDRTDTVVVVRPSDEANEFDVKAAEQVRVDHDNGLLRITGPKIRPFDYSRGKVKSVELSIELPSGSQLSAEIQMGDIGCAGRLGECRLKTNGNVWLERTGPLRLHTGAGKVTVEGVTGDARISTGSGTIRIGEVDGAAEVKNSNGDTTIGAVADDVRIRNANGAIDIERPGADVDAKTANGNIRLGEVIRGSVLLGTGAGDLDIGIAEGTAAWLEVNTGFGHMRNLLENAARPDNADQTVEVRGRTAYGDITVRRP